MSGCLEIVPAFAWRIEVADVANGFPEGVDASRFDASQMRLELGECHFDRVEIGAIGRQKREPGTAGVPQNLIFGHRRG